MKQVDILPTTQKSRKNPILVDAHAYFGKNWSGNWRIRLPPPNLYPCCNVACYPASKLPTLVTWHPQAPNPLPLLHGTPPQTLPVAAVPRTGHWSTPRCTRCRWVSRIRIELSGNRDQSSPGDWEGWGHWSRDTNVTPLSYTPSLVV